MMKLYPSNSCVTSSSPQSRRQMVGWTHHSGLSLGIVHMGVEQHSCVVVRRLQCNGERVAAILQTEEREDQ